MHITLDESGTNFKVSTKLPKTGQYSIMAMIQASCFTKGFAE